MYTHTYVNTVRVSGKTRGHELKRGLTLPLVYGTVLKRKEKML